MKKLDLAIEECVHGSNTNKPYNVAY